MVNTHPIVLAIIVVSAILAVGCAISLLRDLLTPYEVVTFEPASDSSRSK